MSIFKEDVLFVSVVEYAVTAGPARLARARARGGTLTTRSVTLATSSVTKASPVLCVEGLTGPRPTGRWFSATSVKGNNYCLVLIQRFQLSQC